MLLRLIADIVNMNQSGNYSMIKWHLLNKEPMAPWLNTIVWFLTHRMEQKEKRKNQSIKCHTNT